MKQILFIIAFFCISGTVIYQGVRHDSTLTGDGITGSELKVDTTKISTITRTNGGRSGYITTSPIGADQDNYSPTGWATATHIFLEGDNGIRAITSFAAPTAVTDAYEKTLINSGDYPLYIPSEHPDGTAANRVSGAYDFILYPFQTVKIWYDIVASRWRIIGDHTTARKRGSYFDWYSGTNSGLSNEYIAFSAINSGTHTPASATTSLPMSIEMNTAANSAGGYLAAMSKDFFNYTAFGAAHIYAQAAVSIVDLSTALQEYTVELQFTTSPTSTTLENNNTSGIRYSHGINSGKWELFNQDNAGAESVADLGTTVAVNTMYDLRIEVDKSRTEVRAYVNGVFAGRITGSMPNAATCGVKVIIKKSVGTTARVMNLYNLSTGAIYP